MRVFTGHSLSRSYSRDHIVDDHLLKQGIVAAISRETLRRILCAGGISWQTTTTWNASTDPNFVSKMRRVLDLYGHPPADGRVVCVHEFGPLTLQLRTGKAWRPATSRGGCGRPTPAPPG